jgi:hypothetical protein
MGLPMQTEFRAIVQSEYGAPENVLRIAKRQLKSEELGGDDVLVRVVARPIHPVISRFFPLFLKEYRSSPFRKEL